MIQSACQITFLGMDAVEAAKVEVLAWLPRLGALTDQATGAHVLIEAVDEHRKQRLYRVRMELAMQEGVVVVTHDHPSNVAHEDVYVAIRNAFRAARRQLEDYFKTRSVSAGIGGTSRNGISDGNDVVAQVEPDQGAPSPVLARQEDGQEDRVDGDDKTWGPALIPSFRSRFRSRPGPRSHGRNHVVPRAREPQRGCGIRVCLRD